MARHNAGDVLIDAIGAMTGGTNVFNLVQSMGRAAGLTHAAELISGTTDKKSRAYKSARRRVERYTTEGKEKRGTGKRDPLARTRAGQATNRARIKREGVYVPDGGIHAKIRIPTGTPRQNQEHEDNDEGRDRVMGTGFHIPAARNERDDIPGMREIIELLDAGKVEEAGDLFGQAAVYYYTEQDALDGELLDVASIDLEFGEGDE